MPRVSAIALCVTRLSYAASSVSWYAASASSRARRLGETLQPVLLLHRQLVLVLAITGPL
ncbi:hypothetical protein VV01_00480 [Luteipulveratus halotolerans]|uniref:Uncharacterized protein n=1 Tax=Luteipulveratus halotolerans TaxID=1631356 RepID=A0A0L6CDP0_9MICO|nr:hypothetical protein VV01_00480 [Luteipulveratus halotolerans]